jgi:dolichol-phosphate mannosyltransferase
MASDRLKTLLVIPTYQESDNIGALLDALPKREDLEILVVDDDSPDGTSRIVEEKAQRDGRIRLLLRKEERGRGLAGRAGYLEGLESGAEAVMEMDADFSHDPRHVDEIMEALKEHDVVLGSRFVKGGCDRRSFSRRLVTRLAGGYIRLVLGVRAKDPTSGFRGFRRRVLEAISPETLQAKDPFIVTEVLYRVKEKKFPIHEVPIVFTDRTKGETKLNWKILGRNLKNVLKLRLNGNIL